MGDGENVDKRTAPCCISREDWEFDGANMAKRTLSEWEGAGEATEVWDYRWRRSVRKYLCDRKIGRLPVWTRTHHHNVVWFLLLICILAAHKIYITSIEGCMAATYGGMVCLWWFFGQVKTMAQIWWGEERLQTGLVMSGEGSLV
jgi:hypothetical protein